MLVIWDLVMIIVEFVKWFLGFVWVLVKDEYKCWEIGNLFWRLLFVKIVNLVFNFLRDLFVVNLVRVIIVFKKCIILKGFYLCKE